MTLPELDYTVRFSLASCVTEDSVDSAALATPLDQSPSNTFSIINIVNDDPLPNLNSYPAIASTYVARRRRRAQTSPRPIPSSIIQSLPPPQQPTMIHTSTNQDKSKLSRFWPKIKRIIMSNNANDPTKSESALQAKSKRWLSRNKSRVGPQR